MVGRIGGVVSPFISQMVGWSNALMRLYLVIIRECIWRQYRDNTLPFQQAIVHPYLPAILMGVLAAVAGLLGLFLPETRGTRLPDTVNEASVHSG